MRSQFFMIFSFIIVLYIAANYYSGLAILRIFHKFVTPGYTLIFWLLWASMAILSFLPFAGRFINNYFPQIPVDYLILAGYYWLAGIYYFTLMLLVVDGVFFIGRKFLFFEEMVKDPYRLITSVGAIFLVVLLLAYGTYNARNTVVRHYDLTIAKNAGGISSLRAVLVTDTHLGFIVDKRRLEGMIDMVSELNPDIVFLAGDIIEGDPGFFTGQKMDESWQRLKPKLGIYAVLGNHEYIGGRVDANVKCLNEAGIFVIRDEYVKIGDNFYVVGRDDISLERYTGRKRLKLTDVMKGIDRSLPVILLDHQPFSLDEARAGKVDLQLSGHTHRGQFFPNNFITGLIFENDGGYLQRNGLQNIVSTGFGTWGPPVRIGNFPEIVDISIHFVE